MSFGIDKIDQVMGRINQIQNRIDSFNRIESARVFEELVLRRIEAISNDESQPANTFGSESILNSLSSGIRSSFSYGQLSDSVDKLKPLAQNNNISCGQTSVAMCVNSLTGQNLIDKDIDEKYGFNLFQALNTESAKAGYQWKESEGLSRDNWDLIEQKVNVEKTPVIIGLNGPEFSPSGRGHIITITKVEGDTVYYADPASGKLKTTTKMSMQNAPAHPDGKFIFYAQR